MNTNNLNPILHQLIQEYDLFRSSNFPLICKIEKSILYKDLSSPWIAMSSGRLAISANDFDDTIPYGEIELKNLVYSYLHCGIIQIVRGINEHINRLIKDGSNLAQLRLYTRANKRTQIVGGLHIEAGGISSDTIRAYTFEVCSLYQILTIQN